MTDFLKHPVTRPILVLLALVVLYVAYWFHMAGRIEDEIKAWASDQALDGTEIAYKSLNISGFPFRLIATFEEPDIYVRDGDRSPRWHGQELKAITQAYSFNHVILDFVGTQVIEVEEAESPVGRPLARQAYTIDGSSMMMSLKLNKGKIREADTVLNDLTVSVEDIGDYRPGNFAGDVTHLNIDKAEVHSRVRQPAEGELGTIAHDLSVELIGITSDRKTPNGFESRIERLAANTSRASNREPGFHNGSLRINRDRFTNPDEETLTVHELSVNWAPVALVLDGKLSTKGTKEPSGKLNLGIKGHKDLVRALHEEGEVEPLVAVLAGALFGVVELVSEVDDDGVLRIPLTVKEGEVSFSFVPLFELRDLGLN